MPKEKTENISILDGTWETEVNGGIKKSILEEETQDS